jgi:hypothetical protein
MGTGDTATRPDFELPRYVSLEGVAREDVEHVLLAVREGSMTRSCAPTSTATSPVL